MQQYTFPDGDSTIIFSDRELELIEIALDVYAITGLGRHTERSHRRRLNASAMSKHVADWLTRRGRLTEDIDGKWEVKPPTE